jgi:hypothetical protein
MAWNHTRPPLDMESMIPRGADIWRGRNEQLDELEKRVAGAAGDTDLQAELAKTTFAWACGQRRLLRRYLHARFGIKVTGSFPRRRMRIVDRERAHPNTLLEAAFVRDLLATYMTFDAALWAFRRTSKEVYLARRVEEITRWWWYAKYGVR